jgi:hypothetical protein
MSHEQRREIKIHGFPQSQGHRREQIAEHDRPIRDCGRSAVRFQRLGAHSAKGGLYMKGTHTPVNLTAALKAQIGKTGQTGGPNGVELKSGELILFPNQRKEVAPADESTAEKEKRGKRPDWFGYANTSGGWYQLAGWVQDVQGRPSFIAGTAVLFEGNKAEMECETRAPASKGQRKSKAKLVPGN